MRDQLKDIIKRFELTKKSGSKISREMKYRYPRQYFAWHLYKKGYTFKEIGDLLNQDHTTMINAKNKAENMIELKDTIFFDYTHEIANEMMNVPVKIDKANHQVKKIKPILLELKERINAIRDMEDVEGLKAFINKFY